MTTNTKVAETIQDVLREMRAEDKRMSGWTAPFAGRIEAALARQEADKMDIVAHRLLYLDHSGEWVTHGRPWVDGRPDPKLLTELVEPNSRWRIEYAYAAPPSAPVGHLLVWEVDHGDLESAHLYGWHFETCYKRYPAGDSWHVCVRSADSDDWERITERYPSPDDAKVAAQEWVRSKVGYTPPAAQADDWNARAVAAEKLSVPHGYKLVRDSETPLAAQVVDLDAVRKLLVLINSDLLGDDYLNLSAEALALIDQQAGKGVSDGI